MTETILSPVGRLDSHTAPGFEQEVLAAVAGGTTHMLIDFSNVQYISSAGLRIVLIAAKKMKAAGGKLALCELSDAIAEVFKISGFSSILDIHADQASALAALR
jgi:anti-anti-sigma factor